MRCLSTYLRDGDGPRIFWRNQILAFRCRQQLMWVFHKRAKLDAGRKPKAFRNKMCCIILEKYVLQNPPVQTCATRDLCDFKSCYRIATVPGSFEQVVFRTLRWQRNNMLRYSTCGQRLMLVETQHHFEEGVLHHFGEDVLQNSPDQTCVPTHGGPKEMATES